MRTEAMGNKGRMVIPAFLFALAVAGGLVLVFLLGSGNNDDVLTLPGEKGDVPEEDRGKGGAGADLPADPEGGGAEAGHVGHAPGGKPDAAATGAETQEAQLQPGEVGGRVLDARSRKPVSGAAVRIAPVEGAEKPAPSAGTDEAGRFRVAGVPPGLHCELVVEKTGFETHRLDSLVLPRSSGLLVDTILLDPLPLLEGRVTDHKGKPVASARIALTRESGIKFGPDSDFSKIFERVGEEEKVLFAAKADAAGLFAFYPGEADEGEYCLRASGKELATVVVHGVKLAPEQGREPLEIALSEPQELKGAVVDEGGAPVEGAFVAAVWIDEDASKEAGGFFFDKYWTHSDVEGRFSLGDLPLHRRNRFMVMARKEGMSMAMDDGVRLPQKRDLVLTLKAGFTVEGRILDDSNDRPIAGATVVAMGRRDEDGFARAETDAEGRFRIQNLAPGRFRLIASAKGFAPLTEKFEGQSGEVQNKDIRLKGGVILSGVVLSAADREPLEGVTVANASKGDEALLGGGLARTVSDAKGCFRITGIVARSVRNRRPGPSESKRIRGVNLIAHKSGWIQDSPFVVEIPEGSESVENLELLLQPAPVVSGRVVDSSGKPVSGATLSVVSPGREYGELALFLGLTEAKVTTGDTGRFSIPVDTGASVFLLAVHAEYAFQVQLYRNLQPGKREEGLEMRLTPGGSIEGVVLDESGNPLGALNVEYAYRGDGETGGGEEYVWQHVAARAKSAEAYTDEKGRFSIPRLRPGFWSVTVRPEAARLPAGKKVRVSEGRATHVDIQVLPPLTLRGTVVDGNGQPVAQANVFARAEAGNGNGNGWARSNEDGSFLIKDLPPGSYRVSVRKHGFDPFELGGIQAGTAGLKVALKKAEGR